MRYLDGELLCSASDLVGFAACRHLTQLELAAARGEIARPKRVDPFVDLLSRRGNEHEQDVLATYVPADVTTITVDSRTRAGLGAAAAETISAMRAGARVIYQATFLHDGWVGHADFVERVDGRAGDLGSWSYQAVDSKLARSVKPGAILQLAEYSEHLTRIQGVAPELIVVITGDGARHPSLLADIADEHRVLKADFRATVLADPTSTEPAATYPDRIGHCSVCRWVSVCGARRRADDHLSIVAGIRNDQIEKLTEAGISTRRALADGPRDSPSESIPAPAYDRLRRQAALQVRGEGVTPPLFELLEPGPSESGFAALPAPSPGDLFLDLEGDPMALEGGLEYLFGAVEVLGGTRVYQPFWAHSRAEERVTFEAAVDFIVVRRAARPDLHVYHYAAYEARAFMRLAAQHGTREAEVDALVRDGVFVDLYKIVKRSVLLSTESYGLKAIEKLYLPERRGAVLDAGSSIVAYEDYLADPDPQRLAEIAAYNRDDCESLLFLQAWLEARRSGSVQPCNDRAR